MTEVLPCKLCGQAPTPVHGVFGRRVCTCFKCRTPGCRNEGLASGWDDDPQVAIAKWNAVMIGRGRL